MHVDHAILDLPEIILFPHLGLLPEERANPQEVRLSLEITFSRPVPACLSDDIAGTLCYHHLYDEINALLSRQDFRLIEHLAHSVAAIVSEHVQSRSLPTATIALKLLKVSLPLAAFPQGASFSLRFTVDAPK